MSSPTLVWFRRDLRLSDHAALSAACALGGPVIPVFIHDDSVASLGAAPKWRLGLGVEHLDQTLRKQGSQLTLRSGPAEMVLSELLAETGATSVMWSRLYDPQATQRDSAIKAVLKADGIDARSFGGHLIFEPWTTETKTGGYYKVFTPFWNNVKVRDVETPLPAPKSIAAPVDWPATETLADWNLGAPMKRGADIVHPFVRLGADAAQERLATFVDDNVANYVTNRDLPWTDGTSSLSENLALGEISPHQCWHVAQRALFEGVAGAEVFMKQLGWREFAYHLMHHTPRLLDSNWKEGWDAFPWNTEDTSEVMAWKQGRTGIPFVDAAMRELYVTGRMHNRGRMIVASYLTKHLMTDWRVGQKWFEDCLIDWDPACNAMGWQWSAGSGPDATPYFRVFNPVTQLDKFDKNREYVDRWIAEGHSNPHVDALSFFKAIPKSWNLSPDATYPQPVVTLQVGRERALNAYSNRSF
jgi:deoxyribodipyrimidine photo-lyase